jgi:hypothetical protein
MIGMNKGFQQQGPNAIADLPVLRQLPHQHLEHMRGEVRNPHRGMEIRWEGPGMEEKEYWVNAPEAPVGASLLANAPQARVRWGPPSTLIRLPGGGDAV